RRSSDLEVGVALRNEVELRLRPVQPALALYAAGTDGDLRLDDVVAGSGRIAVGVEEGQDAVLLVRHGDEDPPGRRRQYQGAGPGEDQLPGDTSQQDDEHPGHHDHQRRASVILHQHQPHRQQDNRGTYQQILEARRQRTTGQIPGQQHGHQELLHLGGLETREAGEVEPGGGAVGLDPEQQHDDQQDNAPQIGQQRTALEQVHVNLGQPDHDDEGHQNRAALALHFHQVLATGAVQNQQAIHSQAEQKEHQREVDAQGLQDVAAVAGQAIEVAVQLTTGGAGRHARFRQCVSSKPAAAIDTSV